MQSARRRRHHEERRLRAEAREREWEAMLTSQKVADG